MVDDDVRHPVIVDTDALIAVANTGLWSRITDDIQLTTTNVCYHELKRHVREMSEYAPEGTRERWVHDGSKRALKPFDDEEQSFTTIPCVPRPHGEDAGEKSVKMEIEQNTELYRFAILMDTHGRRAINRVFGDAKETTGKAVAPTFLLYLLRRIKEKASRVSAGMNPTLLSTVHRSMARLDIPRCSNPSLQVILFI